MLAENLPQGCVVDLVRTYFSDYALFDEQVSESLRHAICTGAMEMDDMSGRKVTQKYFNVSEYTTEEQKKAIQQVDLIFETAYVLLLAMQKDNLTRQWTDPDTLLAHYPQFIGLSEDQLELLLRYRNAVAIALTVFRARRNKARIMAIAAKLEGALKDYITGKGQSVDVTRRVQIYEQEGKITAEERPDRRGPQKVKQERVVGAKPTYKTVTPYSAKLAKIVRLQADPREEWMPPTPPRAVEVVGFDEVPVVMAHPIKLTGHRYGCSAAPPALAAPVAPDVFGMYAPAPVQRPGLSRAPSVTWCDGLRGGPSRSSSACKWYETSLGTWLGPAPAVAEEVMATIWRESSLG
jgi:hypothetical protein